MLITESAERLATHYAAAGPPEVAASWRREADSWAQRYGAFNSIVAGQSRAREGTAKP